MQKTIADPGSLKFEVPANVKDIVEHIEREAAKVYPDCATSREVLIKELLIMRLSTTLASGQGLVKIVQQSPLVFLQALGAGSPKP